MNIEYTVYEKYYLASSEWKVNHWRGWLCRNKSVAGIWSWHILGRHINFIKLKTYSALHRPKHTIVPTCEKNSWGLLSISCKLFQKLRNYTFLYQLMWIKCVYLSLVTFKYNYFQFENPTTAKTNIRANILQILRTKALTSRVHNHAVDLCKL